MHAFKPITIAALWTWITMFVLGAILPWETAADFRTFISSYFKQLEKMDAIHAPRRILLMGSSPIIMGLSAAQIQENTAIPTYNIGIFGSRTFFDDYFQTTLQHVKPGDIVVVSDPRLINDVYKTQTIHCLQNLDISCLQFTPHLLPKLYDAVKILMPEESKPTIDYIRQDSHGDYSPSLNRGVMARAPTFPRKFSSHFSNNTIEKIAQIVRDVRARGGCPIVMFIPFYIVNSEQPLWDSEFKKLWQRLDDLKIGDFVFERSPVTTSNAIFGIANEHLNEEGRRDWTQAFIDALRARQFNACASIDPA